MGTGWAIAHPKLQTLRNPRRHRRPGRPRPAGLRSNFMSEITKAEPNATRNIIFVDDDDEPFDPLPQPLDTVDSLTKPAVNMQLLR
jgi:hypothetical protein